MSAWRQSVAGTITHSQRVVLDHRIVRQPRPRKIVSEWSGRSGRENMGNGWVFHLCNGRLIKQLEPVVSARRQDPHVVETETAVLDADKEWKCVTAAQLFEYVLVDTFHIDLEVVRHTEFVEQIVERDAFDSDLSIFTGVRAARVTSRLLQ